eukprot:gnl/Trimastix_PCT/3325.p1 GENE.gnl/Trimastix_PCT/3325~~gnl/Trimastix_PCT/3325.p1  ORF type:complete len:258 (+),score=36.04 gnl/Trimastix_PCT/3325:78-776(+)
MSNNPAKQSCGIWLFSKLFNCRRNIPIVEATDQKPRKKKSKTSPPESAVSPQEIEITTTTATTPSPSPSTTSPLPPTPSPPAPSTSEHQSEPPAEAPPAAEEPTPAEPKSEDVDGDWGDDWGTNPPPSSAPVPAARIAPTKDTSEGIARSAEEEAVRKLEAERAKQEEALALFEQFGLTAEPKAPIVTRTQTSPRGAAMAEPAIPAMPALDAQTNFGAWDDEEDDIPDTRED